MARLRFAPLILALLLPFVAEAQNCVAPQVWSTTFETCVSPGVNSAVGGSGGLDTTKIDAYAQGIKLFINNTLVPLLMAVAFIVFLYGVFKYFILGAADEGSRETGRTYVLYGVIGFVIILSLWGLVFIVTNLFGLGGQTVPSYPTL